ncbi:hypothetical protein BGZ60DRAFT_414186, partial [Tricladium varicosporioides]
MNWFGIADLRRVPSQSLNFQVSHPNQVYPQTVLMIPLSDQRTPPRANSTLSQPFPPFTPITSTVPTRSLINGPSQRNNVGGVTSVLQRAQQRPYCFPHPLPPPRPSMQFYLQPEPANNGHAKKTIKKTRNQRRKEARRIAKKKKEVKRVEERGPGKNRKQKLGIKRESSPSHQKGESQLKQHRRECLAEQSQHLIPCKSYSSRTIDNRLREFLPQFRVTKSILHPGAESPKPRERRRNPDENGIDLYDIPEFIPGVSDYT